MTRVGDDVAFGLENAGVPAEQIWPRVDEALAAVGFGHGRDRPTQALSGGEKQRLVLAGALARRPGLLLLDEPTAQLDPDGAALVRGAVTRVVADRATTLLVVDHDAGPWLPLVDRVVEVDRRRTRRARPGLAARPPRRRAAPAGRTGRTGPALRDRRGLHLPRGGRPGAAAAPTPCSAPGGRSRSPDRTERGSRRSPCCWPGCGPPPPAGSRPAPSSPRGSDGVAARRTAGGPGSWSAGSAPSSRTPSSSSSPAASGTSSPSGRCDPGSTRRPPGPRPTSCSSGSG